MDHDRLKVEIDYRDYMPLLLGLWEGSYYEGIVMMFSLYFIFKDELCRMLSLT